MILVYVLNIYFAGYICFMAHKPVGKITPIDKWVVYPLRAFISNSSMSGILLFCMAILAMIIMNSPWEHAFHHFWETPIRLSIGQFVLDKTLHHWINDGLMAIFFFVVGLELKREMVAGEFSEPRNAILPIVAALGGMVVPALTYALFNNGLPSISGWGIPMATDIAFALGVLYLLGDKVPLSLKLFLTALAIADDLGAVLVIAIFYSNDISVNMLLLGGVFFLLMLLANRLGVRAPLVYAVLGIGGLWTCFLLSGVHATIAAVLAAFTIPVTVKVKDFEYINEMESSIKQFKDSDTNDLPIVTPEQLHVIEHIRDVSVKALTPLQQLEHALHPFVLFVIMPIFALSNAGVHLGEGLVDLLQQPVTLGVFFGLLAGKVIGVVGCVWITVRLGIAQFPEGMNTKNLWGLGFLTGIGFTMSLFVTSLAFTDDSFITMAKIGILSASLIAGIIGYFILRKTT
jgi:NhaA family Na+:H+ antiporter